MAARKKVGAATPAPVSTQVPLHTKYRPSEFAQVLGQDEVVKSIKASLKNTTSIPHAFLFTGPSGTGKTTLARILAEQFHVLPSNIIEADAASNNGIDDMRELTSKLRYHGFGDEPNKLIIIDECHSLTKQAWQSILKTLEEPPAHVFFALCTTEVSKVPETIKTRCACYNLKPVSQSTILDLLEGVCEDEGWEVSNSILTIVSRKAEGSPRRALSMLSMVHDCETKEEAASLLEEPLENKELIEVARMLVTGKAEWTRVCSVLKEVNEPPESIRIIFVNYFAAVLANSKRQSEIERLLEIVAEFSKPMNPSDKLAPILLAIGNILYPA